MKYEIWSFIYKLETNIKPLELYKHGINSFYRTKIETKSEP